MHAQEVPTLTGRVVDTAEILSDQTEAAITELLEAHESTTSNQVAVLTIPSLDGATIEGFANRVFRSWGLGRADVDNGVLLLIARDDRELRIEVGYGLESSLTDAQAGRIIRNLIVPQFRANDFDGGTIAGVNAILGTIEGTYEPPGDGGGDSDSPWWLGWIFLFTHVLLPMGLAFRGLVNPPWSRYFMFVFSLFFIAPMAFLFGGMLFGSVGVAPGIFLFCIYVVAFFGLDIYMSTSPKWKDIREQVRKATKSGSRC